MFHDFAPVDNALHSHQKEAVRAVLDAVRAGRRKILVQMWRGSGVTQVIQTIAASLTNTSPDGCNGVLVIVGRDLEAEHFGEAFKAAGLPFATRFTNEPYPDVTLVKQSYWDDHSSKFVLGNYTFIICAEVESFENECRAAKLDEADAVVIGFAQRPQIGPGWFGDTPPVYAASRMFYEGERAEDFIGELAR